mgnify:CR=1 FL=1
MFLSKNKKYAFFCFCLVKSFMFVDVVSYSRHFSLNKLCDSCNNTMYIFIFPKIILEFNPKISCEENKSRIFLNWKVLNKTKLFLFLFLFICCNHLFEMNCKLNDEKMMNRTAFLLFICTELRSVNSNFNDDEFYWNYLSLPRKTKELLW